MDKNKHHTEDKHDNRSGAKFSLMSKDVWVGEYDYGYLCMPVLNPWGKSQERELPFYGPNERLPVILTFLMGFQHSLSMVGGIITPPLLAGLADPTDDKRYQGALISYSLIVSGLTTIVQVTSLKIPRTPYYLGSGLLSVMGTSFTFLPIVQESVRAQTSDGSVDFPTAYGNLLGVFLVGSLVEAAMSFVPTRFLRAVFPPYISGLTIFLIGASLVGSGVNNWGGGAFCANNPGAGCGVGQSGLPFGSPAYFGLGFFVVVVTLGLELFGSPFMRSCQVALGLLIGYILAAVTTDSNGDGYISSSTIESAPVITFLWTTKFPIGFYAPALLPVLIGFVVSGVETIGDLTATGEASGLEPNSEEQASAVQGGLLGDAVNSAFAALAFSMPNTTFSQNNGVVSLTRVASRLAGFGCACWLLLYGIFGKVGAFFTSIPNPVLGGMTTLLFANIAMSGIKVITSVPLTRRVRFIVSIALAFGLGVTIVPSWTKRLLPCEKVADSPGLSGLCLGASLTISTGYAIGCLVALVLHAILPSDPPAGNDANMYVSSVRAGHVDEDVKETGGVDLEADSSTHFKTMA
uniref:Nucleobase:cation symporter-2, NCS2 family n=1 Tax=Tetraselmis sp. GSL018 TaxID=582737 RepID=A0A061SFW1_9CHLO|mmetsp:Transcript_24389/g.58127  ORF Transcript_24389/g.58127 Transcript_24389/m.58127 type:complete len:577 (+) Transcript_24389:155-1885(+)|eukprot:CAMPEP_0177589366 /NCGR_PEP_ID=MMETSP0419_2-20121207/6762_1 /TAXON_ID=582737 /ORGANISM="Tetraselmis sp., Strain GSL018" /LENGTH=576 /DNA_ID=CAMNT_0019079709 /DNA_START=140 /DNA_END=1870 /DNA_ORIENTATION=-